MLSIFPCFFVLLSTLIQLRAFTRPGQLVVTSDSEAPKSYKAHHPHLSTFSMQQVVLLIRRQDVDPILQDIAMLPSG